MSTPTLHQRPSRQLLKEARRQIREGFAVPDRYLRHLSNDLQARNALNLADRHRRQAVRQGAAA
jgi:hypothetical protein